MTDGVVLDLYAEDLEKDFTQQNPDDFSAGVDLYDDISVPTDCSVVTSEQPALGNATNNMPPEIAAIAGSNGNFHQGGSNLTPSHMGRRHQLYVGNLTWWTTDQDIANAIRDIGVKDFQEVKFFENRSNGQSKGFSVVTLGSEASLRLVLERLPKKELHGQTPAVTYPTKQALNQFESVQETRPVPPSQLNGPLRGPAPASMGVGGPMSHNVQQTVSPNHPQRSINPNMLPGQYRPSHLHQGPPVGPSNAPQRMQAPMHQNTMMGPQGQPLQGLQRFPPNQPQWVSVVGSQPRSNNPRAGPPNGPPQRPQMFQGPPGGMGIRGPRPEWNRPPMHAGFSQGPPPQGLTHMQAQQRLTSGPPPGVPGNVPSPHVNPAFFSQQQVGVPTQLPIGPPMPGSHGPRISPPQGLNLPVQHGPPAHFQGSLGPRGPWPVAPQGKSALSFPEASPLTETEFEEIMSRNRTVSSSAIARAVSDAAASEYSSAIETLATAISLIKQSKVAHDERCKILISSLQDTLHGIEAKSYNRREHSRSRERAHRTRPRRERSPSRYRDRSRERDRDAGYRERSRSRDRLDHYRDDSSSRSARPRKTPDTVAEASNDAPSSKRGYYEERYRSSDRDRERERERERDRERDRRH